MKRLTHVYIPWVHHRKKKNFEKWCLENVSPYSSELTWTISFGNAYYKNKPVLLFNFYEAVDAIAFKLKFL